LSDRLHDLNWLPADGYLIVVENAPQLLSSSAEDQHTLFRILSRAVRHWAGPLGQLDSKSIPFKVLLLCDRDEEVAPLRQEIAYAVRKTRETSIRSTAACHPLIVTTVRRGHAAGRDVRSERIAAMSVHPAREQDRVQGAGSSARSVTKAAAPLPARRRQLERGRSLETAP
jgi:hypothetical protein